MKRIKLTFLTVTILLQIGCGIREHKSEATYRLINDSDHVITLNFSGSEDKDIAPEYSINLEKRGDTFQKTEIARGVNPPGPEYVFLSDSLSVIYDEERITIHSIFDTETSGSLLYKDPYSEKKDIYTYTFTNEDYEKAELIDPN